MRWIKEHKFISALVVIIIVTLITLISSVASGGRGNFISDGINTVMKTITSPFDLAGRTIGETGESILNFKKVREENRKLKDENQTLKLELKKQIVTEQKIKELRELSESLNYVDKRGDMSVVSADIVAMDGSHWMHTFTINVGSETGIKEGSCVIANGGLVGKVLDTGKGWSKIASILDQQSKVSFRLMSNPDFVGITDKVKKNRISGFMIDSKADVAAGDSIVTSGLGKYPEGIPIGTVTETIIDKDRQLQVLTIKPSVNFNGLKKVMVII